MPVGASGGTYVCAFARGGDPPLVDRGGGGQLSTRWVVGSKSCKGWAARQAIWGNHFYCGRVGYLEQKTKGGGGLSPTKTPNFILSFWYTPKSGPKSRFPFSASEHKVGPSGEARMPLQRHPTRGGVGGLWDPAAYGTPPHPP